MLSSKLSLGSIAKIQQAVYFSSSRCTSPWIALFVGEEWGQQQSLVLKSVLFGDLDGNFSICIDDNFTVTVSIKTKQSVYR